jgi:NADPH:quinone reductase
VGFWILLSPLMKAALCRTHGPPELLQIEEIDDPEAGTGQAVVQIVAGAVNFPDVLIMANEYQVQVPTPFIPGSEVAGDVIAVGEGVTEVKLGDRVYGGSMVGAFAEQIALPAAGLKAIPDGVSYQDAAAFGVVYGTAYHTLRSVAEVQRGDTVLVLGAAGGVGLATVELAQVLGATVIAAASTDEKLAVCRERGADQTINYERDDLRSVLREIAPDGIDVVVDPVGGAYAEAALRGTKWGGRFVTVGFASGEIPRIPLNLVLLKGVIVKGFEIRTFGGHAPEEAARDRAELNELFASGTIRPHIGASFPLDRTADALRFVADRKATGKVLIVP